MKKILKFNRYIPVNLIELKQLKVLIISTSCDFTARTDRVKEISKKLSLMSPGESFNKISEEYSKEIQNSSGELINFSLKLFDINDKTYIYLHSKIPLYDSSYMYKRIIIINFKNKEEKTFQLNAAGFILSNSKDNIEAIKDKIDNYFVLNENI